MKNLFINSAAKPAKYEIDSKIKPIRKVDSAILPIPLSTTYRGEEMDYSDRTGIGNCIDYLTKKYLARKGAQGTYVVVSDLQRLIGDVLKGEIETRLVVCSQCHGLPLYTQAFLIYGVMQLYKLGINVVFVKDGIEFRADEEYPTMVTRALKHIGFFPYPKSGITEALEQSFKEGMAAAKP
jgi:hypothetical protein